MKQREREGAALRAGHREAPCGPRRGRHECVDRQRFNLTRTGAAHAEVPRQYTERAAFLELSPARTVRVCRSSESSPTCRLNIGHLVQVQR